MSKQRVHQKRKWLICFLLVAWAAFAVYGWLQLHEKTDAKLETVTMGYQAGDEFDLMKTRGRFVKQMAKKGYAIKFKEFQNGAAMMQALATGKLDYARVGDTPPVSSLAAGTDLTYVAAGGTKEKGSGIMVKKDSGLNSMADLVGKRVAYTKGTSSQYMVLLALQKAGLKTNAIEWVDLDQNAAAVAYAKGKVDAWANWDPTAAQTELNEDSKFLVDGQQTGALNRSFIVSPTRFAKSHRALSQLLIKYGEQDMRWANQHHAKVTKMMTKALKLPAAVITLSTKRRVFSIHAMTKGNVKEEQKIADLFYQAGILKKHVTISKYVASLDK